MEGRHHLGKDLSDMKRILELSRTVTLAGTAGLLLLGPVPALAATFTVTNTNDTGYGSLRYAMTQSNDSPDADMIQFNIPGVGVHTIVVSSDLPTLEGSVTIDGTTQPGYNKTPLIRIDGAGTQLVGLRFIASGSTVKGLNIARFFTGVWLEGGGANTITRCYIGTDATGRTASGNGVGILINSSYNIIGGTNEVDSNLISGNLGDGVFITNATGEEQPPEVVGNVVLKNRIGTRVSGLVSLGNGGAGVHIEGAIDTSVSSNVIGGNGEHGIHIENGALSTAILSNNIGTDPSGDVPLGNAKSGVYIQDSSDTVVGLTQGGQGNIISYNKGAGVSIVGEPLEEDASRNTSERNTIRGNSSGSNLGSVRGIDLGNNGITPDDSRDPDSGPNGFQNFGRILAIGNTATKTQVTMLLSSMLNSTFTVDFYWSPACTTDGVVEAEKSWLGSTTVTTNAYGSGTVIFETQSRLPFLSGVTAAVTDAAGNTSEYGRCIPVP